jgi:hypothetical protein
LSSGSGSRAGTEAHQHSADRPQPNDAPQRAQVTLRTGVKAGFGTTHI